VQRELKSRSQAQACQNSWLLAGISGEVARLLGKVHVCAFCLFSAQGSEDEANHFGREFTNIERHEPLQKRFLRRSMVELLNIRADFPHFTSRIVEHSRYLPLRDQ
jgi:hypothetical protein